MGKKEKTKQVIRKPIPSKRGMTQASTILIFSLMYRMDDTTSTIYFLKIKKTNDELLMTIDNYHLQP